jgi:hypothetical protein
MRRSHSLIIISGGRALPLSSHSRGRKGADTAMAQSERRGGAGACERERAAAPPRSHAHTTDTTDRPTEPPDRPTDPPTPAVPPPSLTRHRIPFRRRGCGGGGGGQRRCDPLPKHPGRIPEAFQVRARRESWTRPRGPTIPHDEMIPSMTTPGAAACVRRRRASAGVHRASRRAWGGRRGSVL